MWLALFAAGALVLHRIDLAGAVGSALPRPLPAWAPFALYFLVAALVRLAIRDARLRPLMRKARSLAAQAPSPVGVADLGLGVGKGVAQVMVAGDFLGPVIAGVDLLAKWLGGAADRKKRVPAKLLEAIARERRSATRCIVAVGAICLAQALRPDVLPELASQAAALVGVGF